MLTLPLYTGLLWLLATQARRPTNLVWISLPMLVLWGNLHGSAALGAHARDAARRVRARPHARARSWLRDVGLLVLAPLAILVTPYGPVTTARYYHLLLVDPPFAGQVTEWRWPAPASNTYAFYVLLAIAIPLVIWGRRRLTVFDMARARPDARRCADRDPRDPVVRVRLHGLRPRRDRPRPREHASPASRGGASTSGSASASLRRTCSRPERSSSGATRSSRTTGRHGPAEAIQAELRPGDRVFVPDRFSDWLLWKIPELRGRIAYDVRFEVYDREFFDRLGDYNWEQGDWKSFADGYRIIVVDETNRSHTADFLEEPGTRVIYKNDELTVIARRMSRAAGPTQLFRNTTTPSRSNTFVHAGSASRRVTSERTTFGCRVRIGESGRTTHGSARSTTTHSARPSRGTE